MKKTKQEEALERHERNRTNLIIFILAFVVIKVIIAYAIDADILASLGFGILGYFLVITGALGLFDRTNYHLSKYKYHSPTMILKYGQKKQELDEDYGFENPQKQFMGLAKNWVLIILGTFLYLQG